MNNAGVREAGCRALANLCAGAEVVRVECTCAVAVMAKLGGSHNAFILRFTTAASAVLEAQLRYSECLGLHRRWRQDLQSADDCSTREAAAARCHSWQELNELPPFPPKRPFTRRTDEFLRERGEALAAYLQAGLAHPRLAALPETHLMLTTLIPVEWRVDTNRVRVYTFESRASSLSLSSRSDSFGSLDDIPFTPSDEDPPAASKVQLPQQMAAEAGAVEALVEALRAHPGSSSVQAAACAALTHVAAGRGRKQAAAEAGALAAVVFAMDSHPHAAAVQEAGARALREIAAARGDFAFAARAFEYEQCG